MGDIRGRSRGLGELSVYLSSALFVFFCNRNIVFLFFRDRSSSKRFLNFTFRPAGISTIKIRLN